MMAAHLEPSGKMERNYPIGRESIPIDGMHFGRLAAGFQCVRDDNYLSINSRNKLLLRKRRLIARICKSSSESFS